MRSGDHLYQRRVLRKISKPCLFTVCCLLILLIGYKSNWRSISKSTTFPMSILEQPLSTLPYYPYVIEEAKMCEDQSPYLLLLIPSMPQDAHIREVLRKTWANESLITGISIKRIFLLGRDLENVTQKDLEKESFTFHDIIQQDFLDTYYNLTVKTMMGLEWASRLCPNASYVMKIDTDMFFNPWFLVNQVLQPNSPAKSGFFTGLLVTGSVPLRDKGSKWYMPFSVFSKSQYPPYCSGTGYVFSGDLSARIYNEGRQLPIIPYEDVFVGMCLNRMGLQITRPAGNWFIGEKLTYNRCKFAEIVTVHHFQPDELLKYWPDFLTAVESCT